MSFVICIPWVSKKKFRKKAIDVVFMSKIESRLCECEMAIEKIRNFAYCPEEKRVVFMIKKWTNLGIYYNNMYKIKDSLRDMAFINETEERKGFFLSSMSYYSMSNTL